MPLDQLANSDVRSQIRLLYPTYTYPDLLTGFSTSLMNNLPSFAADATHF